MTSETAIARQIVRPTEEAGCVEPVAATGFEPDGSPIGRLGYPGQGTATLSIPALRQGPLRDPRDRLRQMNLGRPHWQKHSSTAAQTMTPQAGSHCERRRWNLRLSLYRVTSCEQSRCPFVPDSLTSCSGNLKSSSNFPANIHRFTPRSRLSASPVSLDRFHPNGISSSASSQFSRPSPQFAIRQLP